MTAGYRLWADPHVVASFHAMDIPYQDQQVEVFLRLLPFERGPAIRVLDLGCGGGTLLETMLAVFPQATGVGVDFSAAMLERARRRLARLGDRVRLLQADFDAPDWPRAVGGPFDAIVSRYAIHHVTDDRKRAVYADAFGLLSAPGVFVNVEHVASASPHGEALYDRLFVDTLYAAARQRGESPDYAGVQRSYHQRPDKAANLLAPVEAQLGWLRAAGFADVDCYWKCFELAILAGYRR